MKNRKTPIAKSDSKINIKKQKIKDLAGDDFIILDDDDDADNGRRNSSSSDEMKDNGVRINYNDRNNKSDRSNNQKVNNNSETANNTAVKIGWVCSVCTYVHSIEHSMYLQCAICSTNRPANSIQS
jgi:rubrerythrin